MTTVLFIHGTGVRERKYLSTLAQIKNGLGEVRPGLAALGCYWGEIGAELRADGASFSFDPAARSRQRPASAASGAGAVPEREKELAHWACLLVDPLFEIRLHEFAVPPQRSYVAATTLADKVRGLPTEPGLAAEVASMGLTEAFATAVTDVTGSAEFKSAFDGVRTASEATRRLLARAVVAQCLAIASDTAGADLTGEERDQLVGAVAAAFGVPDHGIGDRVGEFSKNLAFSAGGPWLRGHRRDYIESVADILLYQARGEAIRRFVRDRIREVPGPVVLLAHSLGGIVAFDLLAGAAAADLDRVRLLVTVGSQVPLLYELGALSSGIGYPAGLPERFAPRWVNVYDPHDLLAYAGSTLFRDGCRDLPIDTGTPFPTAHWAYWRPKSGLYRRLAEIMRGENL
jgi:hypothetical protein